MRTVFVNLPVNDLPATKAFWTELGFAFDARFSNDDAACLVLQEGCSYAMLLTQPFFRSFVNGDVADAWSATEVITCLSADSREEVDGLLATALAAGAKPWQPVLDQPPMYGASFQDLDGHVWELVHMPQQQ